MTSLEKQGFLFFIGQALDYKGLLVSSTKQRTYQKPLIPRNLPFEILEGIGAEDQLETARDNADQLSGPHVKVIFRFFL
jgi:hypothetical protein